MLNPSKLDKTTNRFVSKLRGFGHLTSEEVAVLARATATPRKVAPRRDLIREGDRPGPVFVILDGWSCRYKILPNGARQVLAYLMPGDCCDLHINLLSEMDHGIHTVTQSLVCTIDREDMDTMLERHHGIARSMYISQLVDEGIMRAWITSMGRRSSTERVAHLMCELYIRAHNIGLTTNHSFSLPLSQLMLADSLGMTPVHLNRVLRELRIEGAMSLGRGNLTIADPLMLVQIAGFDENYLHRRLRQAA